MNLRSAILALFCTGMVFSASAMAAPLPPVTYPPHLKFAGEDLPTVVAEKWLQVADDASALEGLCFDRQGNLWLVGVQSGKVYRVTPDKKITVVKVLKDRNPAGLKIHKNGRIYVACLGDWVSTGSIVSFNPDGSDLKTIVPESAGFVCDDLIFDDKGGFYFTNYKGSIKNEIGTVEYVSPDHRTITTVAKNLGGPNGIVRSGKHLNLLIVTEANVSRSLAFTLQPDGSLVGTSVIWNYQGMAIADSIETDADGNLYSAIWGQGRYIVFNSLFNPIAQIVVPERGSGHMMYTAHSAIVPGTDQVLLCASDKEGGQGSALYTVKAPAKAWKGYYQFQ